MEDPKMEAIKRLLKMLNDEIGDELMPKKEEEPKPEEPEVPKTPDEERGITVVKSEEIPEDQADDFLKELEELINKKKLKMA